MRRRLAGCVLPASDRPERKESNPLQAGELAIGPFAYQVSLSLPCKNSRRARPLYSGTWILLPFSAVASAHLGHDRRQVPLT